MSKRIYLILGLVVLLFQAAPAAAQGPIGPAHTDPAWRATYWNNPTLSGQPVLQRNEIRLEHDWGSGAPDPAVNADRFSARWTRYIDVTPGTYRFTATADDGIRLWVDDELLINQWHDQSPTTYTAETYLGPGHHWLQVEYYENMGGAVARVSWTEATQPSGGWRAEYFNNRSLSGAPALVRNDPAINFDWGTGSPAPGRVESDHFSVRWSRSLELSSGNHRFTLTTDDGARLFVNGHLLIDAWKVQGPTTYFGDIYLPGGPVTVQMEYFEKTGTAVAKLSWDRPGGRPTPPPPSSPVGYVTSYRLNVRFGPGLDYKIKDRLFRGDAVALLGRDRAARWLKVETETGVVGWVSETYIRSNIPVTDLPVLADSPAPPPPSDPVGQVTAYKLNVRFGPGVNYGVKGWLSRGQSVFLLGRNGSATWFKVETKSGFVGWVSGRYIRSSVPPFRLPVVR